MQTQKFFKAILFFIFISSMASAQGISFDSQKDSAIHDFRINLLVGVSEGISKMELGGFVNIDRKDVKYIQMAGFGNIVGGNVTGCQMAGFINTNGGETKGIQGAGFGNYSGKDMTGVQGSGFFNYSRNITGIQAAGFSNYARDVKGVQGSGFVNYAKSLDGIQASGFGNYSDSNVTGIQGSGFFNYCGKTVKGLQASGFINIAKTVKKGLQIAPFNIADSMDGGLPIGVFSYVRKGGYHKIEISADELFFANVAVRTGVKQFYNILSIGVRPTNVANPFWTYGYGLGTSFGVSKKADIDIEVTSNHINYGAYWFRGYSSNNYKFYAGVDFHISDKISIAAGPTVNFYSVYNYNSDLLSAFNAIKLPYIYDQKVGTNADRDLKVWVGGKVAIRFL
jgi:hypothetical protein